MIRDKGAFFASLEEIGETEVRGRLAQGVFAKEKHPLIHEWLRRQDEDRASAAADRAEEAASRIESIERSKLREQRRLNKIATTANIIAIVAATVATIAAIVSIIGSFSS